MGDFSHSPFPIVLKRGRFQDGNFSLASHCPLIDPTVCSGMSYSPAFGTFFITPTLSPSLHQLDLSSFPVLPLQSIYLFPFLSLALCWETPDLSYSSTPG